jgi:hypothetical protein
VITNALEKLMQTELDVLDKLIDQEDIDGFGEGFAGPGLCLQQGCMLGAQQYLLHYKFEVVSENVKVAYITRTRFEKFLDELNHNEILQMCAEIQLVPYFRFVEISKNALKKIVGASRLVRIPKGWTYHSSTESNQFFLIKEGTL